MSQNNVKITFPDGSVREYPQGVTPFQIAESISQRLAQEVLSATVNGKVVDLAMPVNQDASVKLNKWEDPEGKATFWHTSSHLLAEALESLYPGIKFGIGPSIENGFYYDVDSPVPITEADLPKIEKKMEELARTKEPLVRREVSKAEAMRIFTEKGDQYKTELIGDLQDGTITFYTNGCFTDLCRGPHLPNTGLIKAIKLTSVAGAYWRGNEKNKMLTRIYGITFPKKSMLDEYLAMLEEAKKRDHRKIGREMDLFMMRDEAPGFPFFLPNGMILKNTLLDYWREIHHKAGYVEISTPLIMNKQLWKTSGHWDHYKDNMYSTVIDDEEYCIKPMNCPGGVLVYASKPHSYRELPIRAGEIGLVHRHELRGALHGLFRVRCFNQDDAHLFVRPDQLTDEIVGVVNLIDSVYQKFGFKYHVELSTRPEDSMGSDEDWARAEEGLRTALEQLHMDYEVNEGDGAFYGPKIDFHLEDSLGRTWQCGTVQLDFQMPLNFDLEYVDADGTKKRPIMLHRVCFGSIERFIGILIEHFAGKFPTWLAPVQVKALPVSEKSRDYAHEVCAKLEEAGIRVVCDDRDEKIGYKIREARSIDRVPYMLILGEKEVEAGNISVRDRSNETVQMTVDEFVAKVTEEIKTRA